MADETIRDLERQAAQGDRAALARLLVERARAGDLDGVVLLGHCHRCAWWSNDERNPWNWGFCRVAETRVVTWMRERPPGLDPRYAEETEYEPVAGDGAMACAEPRAAEEQDGDGAELFTRGDFGCVQWTQDRAWPLHRLAPGAEGARGRGGVRRPLGGQPLQLAAGA